MAPNLIRLLSLRSGRKARFHGIIVSIILLLCILLWGQIRVFAFSFKNTRIFSPLTASGFLRPNDNCDGSWLILDPVIPASHYSNRRSCESYLNRKHPCRVDAVDPLSLNLRSRRTFRFQGVSVAILKMRDKRRPAELHRIPRRID